MTPRFALGLTEALVGGLGMALGHEAPAAYVIIAAIITLVVLLRTPRDCVCDAAVIGWIKFRSPSAHGGVRCGQPNETNSGQWAKLYVDWRWRID